MEKQNTNMFIISIVAIVAIVGMIFLFSGQNKVAVQGDPINTISDNLGGQAYVNSQNVKTGFIKDPKNIILKTTKGTIEILSAEGPNGEKCTIDIDSFKKIITNKLNPIDRGGFVSTEMERYTNAQTGDIICTGACTITQCCTVMYHQR